MDELHFSPTESGFSINGFPDAIKAISLDGPVARRLADLFLHKQDLDFSMGCLDTLKQSSNMSTIVRNALWRSAIVYFVKCFGEGARCTLSADRIYKNEPSESLLAFNHIKNLRNKHVVHDENNYNDSRPGALLNNGKKKHKIEKIVCVARFTEPLDEMNYGNLTLLVQKARDWVTTEFDSHCTRLTDSLEQQRYEDLVAMENMQINLPSANQLNESRKKANP
jgi:hypothetical protein